MGNVLLTPEIRRSNKMHMRAKTKSRGVGRPLVGRVPLKIWVRAEIARALAGRVDKNNPQRNSLGKVVETLLSV